MAMGINQLSAVILVLVVAAITLGLGLTVLQSFVSATTGSAQTATNATLNAVGTLGSTWFPIVVLQNAHLSSNIQNAVRY